MIQSSLRLPALLAVPLLLSACAGQVATRAPLRPVEVKIIAFNDLHGNLEPPKQAIPLDPADPAKGRIPAGGVAYLATAIDRLRAQNPNNAVVSAGDMIGASPLVSALFLDEPTIQAMNLIKMDFNAAGNHEFDKGWRELVRMQKGGCAKHTLREPCRLERFKGADFGFLAANTVKSDGKTLFPAFGLRHFGKGKSRMTIGFIGMTLQGTANVVSQEGVAGLDFRNEADTANALVPVLKAKGADVIAVIIHEGGYTKSGYNDKACAALTGDILPVLDRLDPAVDLVISGHNHFAYVCDYAKVKPDRPFLLTSAGQYGTMLTDIRLVFDPVARKLISKTADNIIVQGEGFTNSRGSFPVNPEIEVFDKRADVSALVERYVAATREQSAQVIGSLSGPATRQGELDGESVAGNLIADAQLAATRTAGAQIAFMNASGIRADLVPDDKGALTFGAIFAAQPFGNSLVTKTMTGAQIQALLEQQFGDAENPMFLMVSNGFRYSHDARRPAGSRAFGLTLDGAPLDPASAYRVTMNSFLAGGGDKFSMFTQGTSAVIGGADLDALQAYVAKGVTVPALGRVTKVPR